MSNETRKAEAQDAKVGVVKFRGHEFTIPTDYAEWSLDLHEALEDGRNIGFIRAALGAMQWEIVRGMKLKTADIDELAAAAAEAFGFKSVGESQASSD